MPTKLIEVALPLDVINREAAREKSIRHGHPNTLHLWWARRPLAACRAVLFAQLVDDPSAHPSCSRQKRTKNESVGVCLTSSNGLSPGKLRTTRRSLRRPEPKFGAAILRDHRRSSTRSAVADLSLLSTTTRSRSARERPQPRSGAHYEGANRTPSKFAHRPPVHRDSGTSLQGTKSWRGAQGLAEDVCFYGQWMREEAERRIGHLYPKATLTDGQQATVIAWLWARTVTCPNPRAVRDAPCAQFLAGEEEGTETWVPLLATQRRSGCASRSGTERRVRRY